MLAGIGHANLKQLLSPNGCLLFRMLGVGYRSRLVKYRDRSYKVDGCGILHTAPPLVLLPRGNLMLALELGATLPHCCMQYGPLQIAESRIE